MSNKMEADEHEVEIAARAMMRDLTKTKNYSHGCLFDFPPVNPDNVVVRGHAMTNERSIERPSDWCCLNSCTNPDVCNKIGKPCGWDSAEKWRKDVVYLSRLATESDSRS
jgi:hypothetical protein